MVPVDHLLVELLLAAPGLRVDLARADAVKLEGGAEMAPQVTKLVQGGIPVMAHVSINFVMKHTFCGDPVFVTVEAQSESVILAKKSARYNGLDDRFEIREGDFRAPEVLRAEEKFDLITGSPPYFPPEAGVKSEHPQKLACRFELRGTVADYSATAARHRAGAPSAIPAAPRTKSPPARS